MRRPLATLLALGCGAALADPAPELGRCREISDGTQRLACYDALPAAPAGAPAPPDPERAGNSPATPDDPSEIRSKLVGPFKHWSKGTQFLLANGQVWAASGDSDGYYPGVPDDAPVRIHRSFTGAWWLQVGESGPKLKVRRIQ